VKAWLLGALLLVATVVVTSQSLNAASNSLEARVQVLEDRAEIEQLLLQYGRALDARDFDAYADLFAADGEWSGSIGTFKGPANIKAAMLKAFPALPAGTTPVPTFHLLTNALIDVHGDRATAVSKWTFIRVDGKPNIALAGRYEDTLVREHGRWKFLRRVAPAVS
jgi:uncharacterized protein (TIGR02246 family)